MEKRCPKCTNTLSVDTGFGWRKMGNSVKPQSWCFGCRTAGVVAKKKSLKLSVAVEVLTKTKAPVIPPAPTVNHKALEENRKKFKYSTDKTAEEFISKVSKRYKHPPHEEQNRIIEKMQSGDMVAKEQFLRNNLGLVMQRVNRFGKFSHLNTEDLFQEGIFGLERAGRNFDTKRGFKFSTYAAPVIDTFINRAVKSKERLVKLLPSVEDKLVKMQRAWSKALADGTQPTQQQLSEMCDLSIQELDMCKLFLMDPVSLNQSRDDDDDHSMVDNIISHEMSPEEKTETSWDVEQLNYWLSMLEKEDNLLISARFGMGDGEPKTRIQLAQMFSTTEMDIQRREKRILALLKTYATRTPLEWFELSLSQARQGNIAEANVSYARSLKRHTSLNAEFGDDSSRVKAERPAESAGGKRRPTRSSKNPIPALEAIGDSLRERLRSVGSLGGSVRRRQPAFCPVAWSDTTVTAG